MSTVIVACVLLFFVSMVTDSGFSGEDLVSDLLGFYRVVTNLDLFPMLKPVSKESAIRRWHYYGDIGKWKNESFIPLLFPDPADRVNPQPVRGQLPNIMQTVNPWSDFTSGIVSIVTHEGTYMDRAKGGSLPFA